MVFLSWIENNNFEMVIIIIAIIIIVSTTNTFNQAILEVLPRSGGIWGFDTNTATRRNTLCCWECTSTSSKSIASPSIATVKTSVVLRGGGSGSTTSSNRRLTSHSSTTTLPVLLSSKHGRRKACSFYIWNAPSALLHRWCHHLQRDNIYEGLGGKKFVRIQPGSMLQLLHPCGRYSTDKCVLCGGTFRDHLTLWWSRHLYTPFDRYLDQVYHDSVTNPIARDITSKKRNLYIKSKSSDDNNGDSNTVKFGYHRQYVLDVSALFDKVQKPRDRAKELQRLVQQRYRQSTGQQWNMNTMEQRRWPPFSNQPKVNYIIPRDSAIFDNLSSMATRSNKSIILSMARDICLDAVDTLLDLQQQIVQ